MNRRVVISVMATSLLLTGGGLPASAGVDSGIGQSNREDTRAPGTLDSQPSNSEPWTATGVAGSLIPDGTVLQEPTSTLVDDVMEIYGAVIEDETLEVDDVRLRGSLTRVVNADAHRVDEDVRVVVQSFVYRIENDRGSWSGQGTALVHAGGELTLDQVTNLDTVLLTGEGGYAGLGAYLLVDWTEDPPAVEGAIFGGEMPPHPRLPR